MKTIGAPKLLSMTSRVLSTVAGLAGFVTWGWLIAQQNDDAYSSWISLEHLPLRITLMVAMVVCAAAALSITREAGGAVLWALGSLLLLAAVLYVVLPSSNYEQPFAGAGWSVTSRAFFPLLFAWMLVFVFSSKAQPLISIGIKLWALLIAVTGFLVSVSLEALSVVTSEQFRYLFSILVSMFFIPSFPLLPVWWTILGVIRLK